MTFPYRTNINLLLRCIFILCLMMCIPGGAVFSETARITVVISPSSAQYPYERIARSIVSTLKNSDVPVEVVEEISIDTGLIEEYFWAGRIEKLPDLIITVGRMATLSASRNIRDIPVIFCGDLNASFLKTSSNPDMNGITLRIPYEKQFEVMKEAFPDIQKVGCIFSRENSELYRSAMEITKKIGLEFVPREITGVQDVPGAIKEMITELNSGPYFVPFFSADGKELWFSNQNPGIGKQSYIESVTIEDMTRRIEMKNATHGIFSHNGRYLTYVIDSTRELAVLDTATNEVRILADPKDNWYFHSFTPDDEYIITTLPAGGGNENLFRIPVKGGEPEQLTFHEGNHWFPSISPDGKWILYTVSFFPIQEWGKKTALFVYNTETKVSKPVFPDLKENHAIGVISPDGEKFVYYRGTYRTKNISMFIADADFGNERGEGEVNYGTQLILDDTNKWCLNWSPDGEWITYIKDRKPHILHVKSGKEKNLAQAGLLWMPPEAIIHQNSELKNRLENMIRNDFIKSNVPIMAGSERAAQAGSALALGIDYEDMGKQTAGLVLKRLAGGAFPIPVTETPRKVLIYINESVASSLGITFPKSILEKAILFGTEEVDDLDMYPYPIK